MSRAKLSYEERLLAIKEYQDGNGSYEKIAQKYGITKRHPLFHSDRGFQYTNKTFHSKLMEAGMRQSMSIVGQCIDNGPMEGYWGILKSEMYYLKKFTSQEELSQAIENYIDFYNTKRFQLKLNCMTPMEFHHAQAA